MLAVNLHRDRDFHRDDDQDSGLTFPVPCEDRETAEQPVL